MTIHNAIATGRAIHRDQICDTISTNDLIAACAVAHRITPHRRETHPDIDDTSAAAAFVFHVGYLRGASQALRDAAAQPHVRRWHRRRALALAAKLSWHAFTHSDTYPSFDKIPATSDWHHNGWTAGTAAITRSLEPLAAHLTPAVPTSVPVTVDATEQA